MTVEAVIAQHLLEQKSLLTNRALGYLADGRLFKTRWSALSHLVHKSTYRKNPFEFTDDIKATLYGESNLFNNIDWTKPIKKSLDKLMLERALMLRDQASYLSLMFSGGSDSTKILETFVLNNILLDEVIVNYNSVVPKSMYDYQNIEPFLIARETLKKLPLDSRTKVTFRTTESSEEYWWHTSDKGILEEGSGWYIPDGTSILTRSYVARKKEICISGISEPAVFYDKSLDKYYHILYDTDGFLNQLSDSIVPFYTSHDFPELQVKQNQIIKDYFRATNTYIDRNKDYLGWKDLVIRETRQTITNPNYKLSHYYDKKLVKTSAGNLGKKVYSTLTGIKQYDENRLKQILGVSTQNFFGIPLHRHPTGIFMGKWYLE